MIVSFRGGGISSFHVIKLVASCFVHCIQWSDLLRSKSGSIIIFVFLVVVVDDAVEEIMSSISVMNLIMAHSRRNDGQQE